MPFDFTTKTGFGLSGLTLEELNKIRTATQSDIGISIPQMCEAASYSMAMVVRFALGLSATGGITSGIIKDTLCGWIVAATIRHLVNAGASAQIILTSQGAHSENLALQLRPLEKMGIPIYDWTPSPDQADLKDLLEGCHNTLFGIFDPLQPVWNKDITPLIEILNEVSTPCHCIELPYGVDPNSGKPNHCPLFASSTLSLGAPLKGLAIGNEFVGRHYVCDISITKDLYLSTGQDLTPLFSDQPVIQLLKEES